MSLVVLKRKAGTKYGKLSSRGNNGFSLNNPRRIESKIGRMRRQTQTPMKGTSYRGHGGCCGTYPITVHKNQYINSSPFERSFDNEKINTGISVKNHHGSMAVRHKWLKRGYPHYVTKDMRTKTYQEYIEEKASQSAASQLGETSKSFLSCEGTNCHISPSELNIVKRVDTLSQGEYMRTKLMNKNCLPPPPSKQSVPIACVPHCGGCSDSNTTSTTNNGNCA